MTGRKKKRIEILEKQAKLKYDIYDKILYEFQLGYQFV